MAIKILGYVFTLAVLVYFAFSVSGRIKKSENSKPFMGTIGVFLAVGIQIIGLFWGAPTVVNIMFGYNYINPSELFPVENILFLILPVIFILYATKQWQMLWSFLIVSIILEFIIGGCFIGVYTSALS